MGRELLINPTPSGHALGGGCWAPWGVPGLSLPSPGQLLASSSGVLNTKPKTTSSFRHTDKETLFVFRLI